MDGQSGTAYKKSGSASDDQTTWTFAKEGSYSESTGSSQHRGTWKFTDPDMVKLLLTESGTGKSQTADIGQLRANHLEMTFKYDKNSDADALFLVAIYAHAAKLDASKGTSFSLTYRLIPSH